MNPTDMSHLPGRLRPLLDTWTQFLNSSESRWDVELKILQVFFREADRYPSRLLSVWTGVRRTWDAPPALCLPLATCGSPVFSKASEPDAFQLQSPAPIPTGVLSLLS